MMQTHLIIQIIGNIDKKARGLILETDAQADIIGEYYLTGAIIMCTSKLSKNGVNFLIFMSQKF